ncbi:hypothetical protein [Roseateles violae]|nr:hypothetical protein [Pelomonas sp. PFR6]
MPWSDQTPDSRSPDWQRALQEAPPAEAERLLRAAAQSLLQWQLDGAALALPPFDEAALRRELQLFVDACVVGEHQRQWTETQQRWWAHCCQVLARNHAEQPRLPMLADAIDAAAPRLQGPLGYELAALLRGPALAFEEEQELDAAIRYWEQARKAQLPVDADFGEFWRRLELSGLQRHLALLGAACREGQRGQAPADDPRPRLFAYAIKVSTRYIELSPLTQLLQDLQGGLVQTAFR